MTAFEKQGQRRSDVDDAAFQMELAYRKDGYAFGAVDYQIEQVAGELVVTFTVTEGPRVIVQKIDITGNATIATQTLLPFFEEGKSDLSARVNFSSSNPISRRHYPNILVLLYLPGLSRCGGW